MKNISIKIRFVSAVSIAVFIPILFLQAQESTDILESSPNDDSKISESEPSREEVFILPPFIVTTDKDTGYYSANTTGVTRTNTLVKNAPLTLSIVNEQLLDDLQIFNDQDLDQVVASIDTEAAATTYSLNTFSMRGFNASYSRYDYFTRALPRDNYNNKRVEVIRGANSLIYGQADPGGAVNYVPKQAQFNEDFGSAGLSYGSYATKRQRFDINRILNDKLAFRLMGTKVDQGYEQTYKKREFEGVTLEATYRPTYKSSIRAHYEYVNQILNFPSASMNDGTFLDYSGISRGLPYANGVHDLMSEGVIDLINNYNTNASRALPNMTLTETMASLYSQVSEQDYGAYAGPVRIVDYNFLRFNNQGLEVYAPELDITNEAYLLMRAYQSESNRANTGIRSTLSWDFEARQSNHSWLFGFDFDHLKIHKKNYALLRNGSAPNNVPFVNNDGTINNFDWNETNQYGTSPFVLDVLRLSNGTSYPDIDLFGNNAFGTLGHRHRRGIFDNANENWMISEAQGSWTLYKDEEDELITLGFWTAMQSEFLNGRLRTLVGSRFDTYDILVKETDYTASTESGGGKPFELKADGAQLSSTLGALYWLTSDLGIFANFSQSIRVPQAAQKTVFGEIPEPELGQGIEGGIRFSFMDNALNGQIVAFHIQKENDIGETFEDYQIDNIFPQEIYPNLYGPDDNILSTVGNRINGITNISKGIELDFNYNPNSRFTLALSYAYTDFKRGDVPENIEMELATRSLLGKPTHRASLTSKYSFNDGALKGFTVGVNQTWRSDTVAKDLEMWVDDSLQGRSGEEVNVGKLVTPDEFNTRLFCTYQKKLGKGRKATQMTLNFQINNIFNEDGLTSRRDTIFYRSPRSYNLSANFAF
jgi:outer membrane receptor protein involved in Fe transport